jgi:hypothetical protein
MILHKADFKNLIEIGFFWSNKFMHLFKTIPAVHYIFFAFEKFVLIENSGKAKKDAVSIGAKITFRFLPQKIQLKKIKNIP